jgi:hypothetical protein
MISVVHNKHWKEISSIYPDKYFDWVVDDIPYGIGAGKMSFLTEKKHSLNKKTEL